MRHVCTVEPESEEFDRCEGAIPPVRARVWTLRSMRVRLVGEDTEITLPMGSFGVVMDYVRDFHQLYVVHGIYHFWIDPDYVEWSE